MCPVILSGNLSYTAISWSANNETREMEKEKRVVYYATKKKEEIARLQAEYSLPKGYNINGKVNVFIQRMTLRVCMRKRKKGLIQIRKK